MNAYINRDGIKEQIPNGSPNKKEVEFCKSILKYVNEDKRYYISASSNGYSDIINEHYADGDLFDGSIVQAAKELNLSMKSLSNDFSSVYLKFSPEELYRCLLEHFLNKEELSLDEEQKIIKTQLEECATKNIKNSVYEITQIYKEFDISISPRNIFKILQNTSHNIKYIFNLQINEVSSMDSKSDLFGCHSKVNIDAKKLINILKNNVSNFENSVNK